MSSQRGGFWVGYVKDDPAMQVCRWHHFGEEVEVLASGRLQRVRDEIPLYGLGLPSMVLMMPLPAIGGTEGPVL